MVGVPKKKKGKTKTEKKTIDSSLLFIFLYGLLRLRSFFVHVHVFYFLAPIGPLYDVTNVVTMTLPIWPLWKRLDHRD